MLTFRLSALLLLLACMLTLNLHAQKWQNSKTTDPSKPAVSKPKTVVTPISGATNLSTLTAFGKRASNRFLFVFDTSSAMKRHADAVQDAVVQIMRSRASGQLFRGDTVGVWTFDSELHTGNFALQTWTPEEEIAIAEQVTTFFKKQRYSKASRIDELMPSVKELVEMSDIITVIVISDGEGQMRNTPFDREINNAYQQNVREMGSERMPVVTVLQGKGGSFYKYTVSALPWPVVIPELPIPLKDEALASKSTTNAPKPQATASPLIITGSKPKPAPVNPTPTPTAPAQTAKLDDLPAHQVLPASVPAANATPVTPVPTPPVEVAKPESTVVAPSVALTEIKLPTQNTEPPPAKPATPQPASAQSAKQMMAAQVEQPPVAVAKATPAPQPEKAEVPPANVKPEPTPSPAAPVVAAVTSPDPVRPKGLLIAAITLLVVALGLVFMMIRRSRPSGPSLITKSMNLRK